LLPPPPPRPDLDQALAPRILANAPDATRTGDAVVPARQVSGDGSNYIIQVASFESRARAARLVGELTQAGYRARDVEFDFGPPRGRLVQVIVGGYSSAIEVERDLQRIRQLPGGYSDARLLER
jgi:cell division septation protein DedD